MRSRPLFDPATAAERERHDGSRQYGQAGLKTDRAEISLLPSTDPEEERRKDLKPIALGSLNASPDGIPETSAYLGTR